MLKTELKEILGVQFLILSSRLYYEVELHIVFLAIHFFLMEEKMNKQIILLVPFTTPKTVSY